jgi:hypothetical protein
MPLSVRYLHLRGHPQTLRAGSQNIAYSDDGAGIFRFFRTICPLPDADLGRFAHTECVTVADAVEGKTLKFRLFRQSVAERFVSL